MRSMVEGAGAGTASPPDGTVRRPLRLAALGTSPASQGGTEPAAGRRL